MLGVSLAVFALLYGALAVVDFVLMRRYARVDPVRSRGRARKCRVGGDVPVNLQNFWFVLIGVLWAGYFVLEGFDFGVGMLLPFVSRNEKERGVLLETIGPVWDGNEVWLVVAGGATFAAFPGWYATMFSGFYIALLLTLFFLIIRVVSFEWREKSDSPRWRRVWSGANTLGSFGAPLSGASRSRTFCKVCRSTRTATTPGTSGISSASTPCSPASRSSSSSRSTARATSRCV